jgi:hypothetical protein
MISFLLFLIMSFLFKIHILLSYFFKIKFIKKYYLLKNKNKKKNNFSFDRISISFRKIKLCKNEYLEVFNFKLCFFLLNNFY